MNSEIISTFNSYGYKSYKSIPLSALKSKKKLECHYLECENGGTLVFSSVAKSRILSKDIDVLDELVFKFVQIFENPCDKKIFYYTSPICSKAKEYAKKKGWILLHVSL